MKYRSRTEITAMMLQAANGGAAKTKIMYKAFISYTQMIEYLAYLQENGLIDYEEGAQQYRTTEKGFQFLRSYEEISELVTLKSGQQTSQLVGSVPMSSSLHRSENSLGSSVTVRTNYAQPWFHEKKRQFQF